MAILAWIGWQLSYGLGGNFQMDCMATLAWTEWQLSCGLGGRIPWNTHLTSAQRAWLEALAACGIETYCWRPSDFEAIAARLQRR